MSIIIIIDTCPTVSDIKSIVSQLNNSAAGHDEMFYELIL